MVFHSTGTHILGALVVDKDIHFFILRSRNAEGAVFRQRFSPRRIRDFPAVNVDHSRPEWRYSCDPVK